MKILLIINIDNTIAENKHREYLLPNWKDFFHACDKDESIEPILKAIRPYLNHDEVDSIFVTGRTGYNEVKEKTDIWLKERDIENKEIHYRGLKDFSKSHIFKEKVLEKEKKENHTQIIILDDDIKIIEHFKQLGHNAIQVDKNNYEKTVNEFNNTMQSLLDFLATEKDMVNSKRGCKI